MRRTSLPAFGLMTSLASVTLLTVALAPLRAQASQSYTVAGQNVGIYNLAGRAKLQPGTGSAVVVEVMRGGADAAKLTVETGQIRDQATLRVRYPDSRVVYREGESSTTIRVRDDGTFNGNNDGDRAGRVTIKERGPGLDAHADLTISIPPGLTVAVYVAVGAVTAANVDGTIRIDGGSGSVDASAMKGFLSVDVGSGEVTVHGVTGELSIDTGSGDVKVTSVSGNEVNIDTGSGQVTASDITTTILKVDTGSGDVSLSGISAKDINLDTGSGEVTLGLTSDAETVKIDTGSGDVTLSVPDSFGATIDIEPGSGGVQSDIPISTRRWSSDHITGTIGDGNGRLRIETGSGGVRLKRTGAASPVRR
jgi:hypothetical protein